jgi:hypothetical protein
MEVEGNDIKVLIDELNRKNMKKSIDKNGRIPT